MSLCLLVFAYMDYRYLDVEYLALSMGDEMPQFTQLYDMLHGFLNRNIEDIFRFGFYNYGFFYYVLNMLSATPFYLSGNYDLAIFAPRMLNAIFAVFCLFMIFKTSRLFLDYFYSYCLVLIVVFMPGFFYAGLTFKPDVFQALLLLICAYCLLKDNFSFSKNFYWGVFWFAMSIGLAKLQAIMFMPLIYAYVGIFFIKLPSLSTLFKSAKYALNSTLFILAAYIITNPYLIHPRGFHAWLGLFLENMQSNATNHGSYQTPTLFDKIFQVIDFYYFEFLVFALLCAFSIYYLFKCFKHKQDYAFMPLIISCLISFLYLFFMVNKTWMIYYVSSIFLFALVFIPIFSTSYKKYLAVAILMLTILGGFYNNSYKFVFNKYHTDLSDAYVKSDEIVSALKPLLKGKKVKILTDNPSFAYSNLGLTFKDIYQSFGLIAVDCFDYETFMEKSNSKNPKYFTDISVMILKKDSAYFVESKRIKPYGEHLIESLETISLLESKYNFHRFESEHFYIYIKSEVLQ